MGKGLPESLLEFSFSAPDGGSLFIAVRSISFSEIAPWLGAVLLLVLAAPACRDLKTGPVVEITTLETVPALQFRDSLPGFLSVAETWGRGLALEALVAKWRESWSQPAEEGQREREEIYQAIVPDLARTVPRSDLQLLETDLQRALSSIEATLPMNLPRSLSGPLGRAKSSAAAARAARIEGDAEQAIQHLFAAADYLQGATSEGIARDLLREGELALRRISELDTYDGQSLERSRRLLLGARSALGDEDYVLALRRAHYGYQLLSSGGGL